MRVAAVFLLTALLLAAAGCGGQGEAPRPGGGVPAEEGAGEAAYEGQPTDNRIQLLQWDRLDQKLEEWGVDVYVEHVAGARGHTLERLEQWIESFRNGDDDTVYLVHRSPLGGTIQRLRCDGSDRYTTSLYDWETDEWVSCESAVVVRRETDYVFASDVGREAWFETWQGFVVWHTDLDLQNLAMPAVNGPVPGAVTQEEACEILRGYLRRRWSYAEGYSSFYGGGQYCPPDWMPGGAGAPPADLSLEVIGSVELMGHPCYLAESRVLLPDGGTAGDLLAVSADSGDLIFLMNQTTVGFSLQEDSGQELLTARAKTEGGM